MVTDICEDSRKAIPGSMFVALPGFLADGRAFIDDAISRGAKYILQESKNGTNHIEFDATTFTYFLYVKHVRRELSYVASKFFSSSFEHMIAVTGTNGKSSTIDFVRQILVFAGLETASIGTLGVISPSRNNKKISENLTSPGPIELHKILQKLSNSGICNIVMEASSHGIEQNRMSSIQFDICAFTKLGHDHLDYHGTIDSYWAAKRRLFTDIANPLTTFVVNADDPYTDDLRKIAAHKGNRLIDYGKMANNFKIVAVSATETSQLVTMTIDGFERTYVLPLFGEFQVYNASCAAAICHSLGLSSDCIMAALANLRFVPGRLELVATLPMKAVGIADAVPALIFVDYAHTPDALHNVTFALRKHAKNRIITLFGCGGDRDQQKRAPMGTIAEKFSDIVIVTNDNPRHEDPAKIRSMILSGCARIGNGTIEIASRECAIAYAIDELSSGDILLVAGKGHENHQQIGDELHHFNDKEVILNWIAK
jgi:UDP-N-acetylmuramoyl-L-alanyl-D-glutamate--2,6-diaminopimelate ligase